MATPFTVSNNAQLKVTDASSATIVNLAQNQSFTLNTATRIMEFQMQVGTTPSTLPVSFSTTYGIIIQNMDTTNTLTLNMYIIGTANQNQVSIGPGGSVQFLNVGQFGSAPATRPDLWTVVASTPLYANVVVLGS